MLGDNATHDFALILASIDGGALKDELSDVLAEVVSKLQDRATQTCGSAKGKLVLTLDLKIDAKGLCSIESDVTTKLPKPIRRGDAFFVSRNGLGRKNPRQVELPLREVPREDGVREAEAVTVTVKGL